ncbi:hypothetical protein B0H11DRAFT_2182612 [Mycena galericulata]|nr:hypothetical protein B0H11DRAFT_2182612 [Mycena galericulata]
MSTPLQKPLLLPGIAPHLFPSGRPHRTVKTSSSDYIGMLIPISYVVHSRAHLSSARRTAEAIVQTQAAEIAVLRASVASLTSNAHMTTNFYHETRQQLMRATIHLTTILTIYTYAETGNEGGFEGALIEAREFVQELKDGYRG